MEQALLVLENGGKWRGAASGGPRGECGQGPLRPGGTMAKAFPTTKKKHLLLCH